MPNDCENYVEIHATDLENGPNSLQQLLALPSFDPFKVFPPPADIDEQDMNNYGYETFGTKWTYQGRGPVEGLCNGVDYLYLFFNSAWAPPEKYYKLLVQKYPGIKVKFEYNEWQMAFCGHGEYDVNTTEEDTPKHYNYETPEELVRIQQDYKWTLVPWNPHFVENSPVNSDVEEDEDADSTLTAGGKSEESENA